MAFKVERSSRRYDKRYLWVELCCATICASGWREVGYFMVGEATRAVVCKIWREVSGILRRIS